MAVRCGPDINAVECLNVMYLEGGFRMRPAEFNREATLALASGYRKVDLTHVASYVEFVAKLAAEVFGEGQVLHYRASLKTPLAVHMRSLYMPLDVAVAWHPILNVPYIPASAVKGAASAYVKNPCGLPPNEAYGTAGFEGGIVFFDAYLVDAPHGLVEPEVLTPHYSEAGLKISEVEARPTPLVYPVIPRGAVFAFLVASRDKRCGREGLKNLLKTVLTRGLGAKTALGFGRFRVE